MDETWLYHYDPETKQQSVEWPHSGLPRPQKIPSAKIRWKSSRLDIFGSRRQPPHWLSSKGPNYELISAGAIEGHFEVKRPRRGNVTKGVLFLHDNAPAHRALETQNKLTYLGFHWHDNPPYSPDLDPSDHRLFPGLKKQLKGRHFSSDTEVIAAAGPGWTDNLLNIFLVACKVRATV